MPVSEPVFYSALDQLGEACELSAGPDWSDELKNRSRKTPRRLPDDEGMMRHFAVAIAYSQGVRSSEIRKLVKERVLLMRLQTSIHQGWLEEPRGDSREIPGLFWGDAFEESGSHCGMR